MGPNIPPLSTTLPPFGRSSYGRSLVAVAVAVLPVSKTLKSAASIIVCLIGVGCCSGEAVEK